MKFPSIELKNMCETTNLYVDCKQRLGLGLEWATGRRMMMVMHLLNRIGQIKGAIRNLTRPTTVVWRKDNANYSASLMREQSYDAIHI